MTTGERGRTPPDAEHYLDLPDAPEEAAGPHFDVVLRGYDRSQVDEHVAGLRRMVAQLRAQLAVRERRRAEPEEAPARGDLAATLQEGTRTTPPPVDASAASPAPAGAPAGSADPGGVDAFNERLRGILQAAEQEAALVRNKAAESLLAEHSESRAALAELRSQRDTVFDELVRVKNHLDELVANSGRPELAAPVGARAAARAAALRRARLRTPARWSGAPAPGATPASRSGRPFDRSGRRGGRLTPDRCPSAGSGARIFPAHGRGWGVGAPAAHADDVDRGRGRAVRGRRGAARRRCPGRADRPGAAGVGGGRARRRGRRPGRSTTSR